MSTSTFHRAIISPDHPHRLIPSCIHTWHSVVVTNCCSHHHESQDCSPAPDDRSPRCGTRSNVALLRQSLAASVIAWQASPLQCKRGQAGRERATTAGREAGSPGRVHLSTFRRAFQDWINKNSSYSRAEPMCGLTTCTPAFHLLPFFFPSSVASFQTSSPPARPRTRPPWPLPHVRQCGAWPALCVEVGLHPRSTCQSGRPSGCTRSRITLAEPPNKPWPPPCPHAHTLHMTNKATGATHTHTPRTWPARPHVQNVARLATRLPAWLAPM